jgi:D-alanyl-D-alanine carboxypeptidase (penicillin-binding protein 5/6)
VVAGDVTRCHRRRQDPRSLLAAAQCAGTDELATRVRSGVDDADTRPLTVSPTPTPTCATGPSTMAVPTTVDRPQPTTRPRVRPGAVAGPRGGPARHLITSSAGPSWPPRASSPISPRECRRRPWSPAVSYVIADLDTGEIIAAKAPHAFLRPASTLKTLTALVALPTLDPGTVITATTEDTSADGSRVGLVANNPYTVSDLFNGLFLVSGNDAAYAIARAYGGRERLLADMNAEVARLGAWDTVAKDPSGLDVDGQFSSAYDLALIGRAGMRLQSFRLHAAMMTATFPGATDSTGKVLPAFAIQNNNPIIDKYPGTIGIKSGFTQAARNTLVAAARHGDRTLIVTSMGSVERQSEAVMSLLDWGFAYAGRARPVGTLVAPGTAPRPPEWAPLAGITSASTSTSSTSGTPGAGISTASITLDSTDRGGTATEPATIDAAPVVSSRPWWAAPAVLGGVGAAVALTVGLLLARRRQRPLGGAYRR